MFNKLLKMLGMGGEKKKSMPQQSGGMQQPSQPQDSATATPPSSEKGSQGGDVSKSM